RRSAGRCAVDASRLCVRSVVPSDQPTVTGRLRPRRVRVKHDQRVQKFVERVAASRTNYSSLSLRHSNAASWAEPDTTPAKRNVEWQRAACLFDKDLPQASLEIPRHRHVAGKTAKFWLILGERDTALRTVHL